MKEHRAELTQNSLRADSKVVFYWDQPFQPKTDLVETVKVPE